MDTEKCLGIAYEIQAKILCLQKIVGPFGDDIGLSRSLEGIEEFIEYFETYGDKL